MLPKLADLTAATAGPLVDTNADTGKLTVFMAMRGEDIAGMSTIITEEGNIRTSQAGGAKKC